MSVKTFNRPFTATLCFFFSFFFSFFFTVCYQDNCKLHLHTKWSFTVFKRNTGGRVEDKMAMWWWGLLRFTSMVVFPETKLRYSKTRGVFVKVTAVMWIAAVIKKQVAQRFPPVMNKFPLKKTLHRESSERDWPRLPHPASICDEVSFRIQVRHRCASASGTLRTHWAWHRWERTASNGEK